MASTRLCALSATPGEYARQSHTRETRVWRVAVCSTGVIARRRVTQQTMSVIFAVAGCENGDAGAASLRVAGRRHVR